MKVDNKSNISTDIIPLLPGHLSEFQTIENFAERDISILSSLVGLSACMPNVTSMYRNGLITPHHYFYVVGPPESGKGHIQVALEITKRVHKHIYSSYIKLKEFYDRQEDNNRKIPKPPINKLLISDDVTASAFVRSIVAQHVTGSLLVSTEAATLIKSIGREHGGFLGQLLKAWSHEMISKDLVQYDEYVCSEFPKLSMVLASNLRDFKRFLGEATVSGLLSRLLLYTTKKEERTISLEGDSNFSNIINNLKMDCFKMFTILSKKKTCFTLKNEQKKVWERHLNQLAKDIKRLNSAADYGILRFSLSIYRQLMVVSVYRAFCKGEIGDIIHPCDADFSIIMDIAYTQAYHALGIYDLASIGQQSVINIFAELRKLPETFKASELIAKLVTAGMNHRTAERRLRDLKLSGHIFLTEKRGILSKKNIEKKNK